MPRLITGDVENSLFIGMEAAATTKSRYIKAAI